jgi:N-methylhydantoinase A/oxoprolinase/acetone carboxylase beta subunit
MPVETILSGPAASVVGASRLSGLAQAVVVDMGGTTTDIALMANSIVATSPHGAVVGGWKTRVHSIDIWSAGLGGDSKVLVRSPDDLSIGPRKAIPFCRAASATPGLTKRLLHLEGMVRKKGTRGELEFFTLVKRPTFSLTPGEGKLLDILEGSALDREAIAAEVGSFVSLERFVELGLIAEIAFTPTDLLHARGELDLWERPAAQAAARLMARGLGLGEETLLETISRELTEALKLNVVTKVLATSDQQGRFQTAEALKFLGALLRMEGNAAIEASVKVKTPLIAVGAPVGSYLPRVAAELGARLVIPAHAEVANAVGAVTGRVVARSEAVIRPDRGHGFVVVTADHHRRFSQLALAEAFALEHVRTSAGRKAESGGGTGIQVTVAGEELTAPLGQGWGDKVFIERRVSATAVGAPSFIA